jgi:hypothetical protein
MIKLSKILTEEKLNILTQRRSKEEREKNHLIATQKEIREYIKNGSEGNLDLSGSPIKSLPQGLTVGKSLYLKSTNIKELPQDLKVGFDLDLSNTPIKSLPQGLKVGFSLRLSNTRIESLPQDLKVRFDLDLSNTPISKKYTKEEIKRMVPGVKGNIYYF